MISTLPAPCPTNSDSFSTCSAVGTPRGQDTSDAERRQQLERHAEVRSHVEGAVHGDRESARVADQNAQHLLVEPTIAAQHANGHTVHGEAMCHLDVAAHDIDLAARVGEVTAARANDHHHRQTGLGRDRSHHSRARRRYRRRAPRKTRAVAHRRVRRQRTSTESTQASTSTGIRLHSW
jgi:hypothetical protein